MNFQQLALTRTVWFFRGPWRYHVVLAQGVWLIYASVFQQIWWENELGFLAQGRNFDAQIKGSVPEKIARVPTDDSSCLVLHPEAPYLTEFRS